jgi:hypothetical protein
MIAVREHFPRLIPEEYFAWRRIAKTISSNCIVGILV